MSVLICKLGDRNESKDFMGDWCFLVVICEIFYCCRGRLFVYIYNDTIKHVFLDHFWAQGIII